jgi:4-hydroxybenzoate polyprenyltransferase
LELTPTPRTGKPWATFRLKGTVFLNQQWVDGRGAGLSRIKLFLALSRTPHGLLDMATPAFAALLWLGAFPSLGVTLLGLLTTFAGYTAVYALNDLVDYRHDKTKVDLGGFNSLGSDLDALLVRHPMAQGFLSFSEGLVWSMAWALIAVIGAYLLNPVCVVIFLIGCMLEAVYCLLWRVSPMRTLANGVVKTMGAMAAVFAVDPSPSPLFLTALFTCLFFWEIGGQNIPNDWIDLEEDRRLGARTVIFEFGPQRASRFILGSLVIAVVFSVVMVALAGIAPAPAVFLVVLVAGTFLLLVPAVGLFRTRSRESAMTLFNRASWYPLVLLAVTLVHIVS